MAVELPTDQLSNILHYISLARYSDLVALVVLVYDYLLTFDLEFSQVWCQRVSLASSLFLWIRYMHPLKIILQLKLAFASPSNLDDSGCLSRQIANILEVITPLVVILIFVNRTWAIYLKSRKILILFGSLGAGLAILKIVLLIVGVSYNVRWEELCAEIGPHGYSTISRMMLLHTIAFFDFTFDSAVFWSTFYKTFHIARDMRLQRNPNSITYWILRDAFMYYLTRISLITHFTPLQVAFGSHLSTSVHLHLYTDVITDTLSVVVVNRMFLSLRKVSNGCPSHRSLPELRFAENSFLQAVSLGASLLDEPGERTHGEESESFEMTSRSPAREP